MKNDQINRKTIKYKFTFRLVIKISMLVGLTHKNLIKIFSSALLLFKGSFKGVDESRSLLNNHCYAAYDTARKHIPLKLQRTNPASEHIA